MNTLNFMELQAYKSCQHYRKMKSCCKTFPLDFFTETLPLTYFKSTTYFPRQLLGFPALLLCQISVPGASLMPVVVPVFLVQELSGGHRLIWLQAADGADMAWAPSLFQIITLDLGVKGSGSHYQLPESSCSLQQGFKQLMQDAGAQ